MIIDTVDLEDLGLDPEEAFIIFEERLRAALSDSRSEDRQTNCDRDGYYIGTYSPERYYVSSVLAFLDEYSLELDVSDISHLEGGEFSTAFDDLFNKINYARTRFKLRKTRISSGQAGTVITIKSNFKAEVHTLLDTIRKVVNANISDQNKKDAIYKQIAALQSEIDRERTTIDAVFGRVLDLSRVVGESAEHLEPLIQKIERVMAALRDGTERVPLLPKKDRPKLLPKSTRRAADDLDDDIPF